MDSVSLARMRWTIDWDRVIPLGDAFEASRSAGRGGTVEEGSDRLAGAEANGSIEPVAELGGGVDAERLVDRRRQVGRRIRPAGGIGAHLVRLADRLAAADARAGEGGREHGSPVVAAVAAVDVP